MEVGGAGLLHIEGQYIQNNNWILEEHRLNPSKENTIP